MRDPYEVLGLLPASEQEVIDAAYRALIKKYHPDRSMDGVSSHRAQEINEAYQVLRDPMKRLLYDCNKAGLISEGSQSAASHPRSEATTLPDAYAIPTEIDLFVLVRRAVFFLIILFVLLAVILVVRWDRVPALDLLQQPSSGR